MKKVFLLGDSIRENYQEKVIEKLGEGYQVFYPNENCRFSAYTLNCLRYWFEPVPEDIDVIHWNNGLWDTAFINDEGVPFLSIDDYIKYMQRILISLRSRRPKAKIILATITPTRKEKENLYYSVNTDLTIETAKKAKAEGVKQFIFMSSAIVYGNSAPIGKKKFITKDKKDIEFFSSLCYYIEMDYHYFSERRLN